LLRQYRNFRLLWLGQTCSLFGDRLHQVAILVLVGSLTNANVSQIGLLFATIGLPSLLFGLPAGALVDRWDRQRVMIVADLIRAPLVLSLPFLARVDLAWVYLVTFLLSTVSLFFRPAKDAIMPDVVPTPALHNANAFMSTTESLLDVIGYPVAGLLVAGLTGWLVGHHGFTLAFAIDAGSYLVSALLLRGMRLHPTRFAPPMDGVRGLRSMIWEGLAFVGQHAQVRRNTIAWCGIVLLTFGSWTLTYGTAALVSSSPGLAYAICEGALGLGAVFGGILVAQQSSRFRHEQLVILGMAIMGLASIGVVVLPSMWWLAAMLALSGVGNMLALIPSLTLIQELTPSGMLGRVVAFRRMLFQVGFIVANLGSGWAAARYGIMPIWGVTGLSLLVFSLGLSFTPRTARTRHPRVSRAAPR